MRGLAVTLFPKILVRFRKRKRKKFYRTSALIKLKDYQYALIVPGIVAFYYTDFTAHCSKKL